MFRHLAVALMGAMLTVLVAWRLLGHAALLLAPFGGSLASIVLGIVLILRGRGRVPAGGS
ncbi:hypothetical protein [Methylobacterium dankookense]|uniref:Uncharacterized protein n=1 Tax=Methylobacterium dankookense TaxID=560405 RepID=A0A564FWV2_9HYPH|nr:hypothetical protein [Methylobacterium dankookense]GJD58039.1 hypothetical protein IFDJLNFL_3953 [Methylobacterium dankookense]VUF12180.1 hypothetical protein MTDSW087_01869 [Methylobacterium dankookense]